MSEPPFPDCLLSCDTAKVPFLCCSRSSHRLRSASSRPKTRKKRTYSSTANLELPWRFTRLYLCACVRVYAHVCSHTNRGQKRAFSPLESCGYRCL